MSPSVVLATVVHDPRGVLLPKWERLVDGLLEAFTGGIGVSTSTVAHEPTLDLLVGRGASVVHDPDVHGYPTIGRRRRLALEAALAAGADFVVYADADHAMRWVERDPDDLRAALRSLGDADLTVFGRTPEAFAEAPAPLRETEALVNAFYERVTGRSWDLLIATRGMRRAVAEKIVASCHEDTIGTDVAWPLFAEGQGFTVGHRYVPLVYETETWFVSGVSEKERLEADPRQWALRSDFARVMFEAFDRWGPGRETRHG